jgi:hypothetical protein
MAEDHTLVIEAGRTERHYWKDLWRYRELFWVFGNYRDTPQHLVFSLMCEGFITFQV